MVESAARANQRAAVRMSHDEVRAFLAERRSMTLSTIGPAGFIHSVAMWYGLINERVAFVSKRKAQKVVNLQRDPHLTCLVEAGDAYSELRGVSLIGLGTIDEAPSSVEAVARAIFERYGGGGGGADPVRAPRGQGGGGFW